MNPVLFALVDLVLGLRRSHGWRLRLWTVHRKQWEQARTTLGWWRSTWVG
jgi:hypothetical protein